MLLTPIPNLEQRARIELNRVAALEKRMMRGLPAPHAEGLSIEHQLRIAQNRARALCIRLQRQNTSSHSTAPMLLDSPRASGLLLPSVPVGFVLASFPDGQCLPDSAAQPVPAATLLQTMHPHPRDEHLTFVEDTHTYYIHGARSAGSVTGLIHQFVHEFEQMQASRACKVAAVGLALATCRRSYPWKSTQPCCVFPVVIS